MDWIEIGSAIAALIAAFEAYRSSRISRKAYMLALQQEARLQPSLALHVLEAEIRRLEVGGPRFYVYRIVVSNASDASNSIREARLLIEYGRGNGLLSNLAASHNADLSVHLNGITGEPFRLPREVAARASLEGILIFRIPNELLRNSQIEAYTLQIVDTYGREVAVETLFLQERLQ